jgi:hypothetical protein
MIIFPSGKGQSSNPLFNIIEDLVPPTVKTASKDEEKEPKDEEKEKKDSHSPSPAPAVEETPEATSTEVAPVAESSPAAALEEAKAKIEDALQAVDAAQEQVAGGDCEIEVSEVSEEMEPLDAIQITLDNDVPGVVESDKPGIQKETCAAGSAPRFVKVAELEGEDKRKFETYWRSLLGKVAPGYVDSLVKTYSAK